MSYLRICALSLTVLAAMSASFARGTEKKIVPTASWSGSVDEEVWMNDINCITNRAALANLWGIWHIDDPLPAIDFNREIVLVITGGGSYLAFESITLDDFGNLEFGSIQSLDLTPGFRYVIATVSRDGVRTVKGKELPGHVIVVSR